MLPVINFSFYYSIHIICFEFWEEKRREEVGCCIALNSKTVERFSESSASINLVKDTEKD